MQRLELLHESLAELLESSLCQRFSAHMCMVLESSHEPIEVATRAKRPAACKRSECATVYSNKVKLMPATLLHFNFEGHSWSRHTETKASRVIAAPEDLRLHEPRRGDISPWPSVTMRPTIDRDAGHTASSSAPAAASPWAVWRCAAASSQFRWEGRRAEGCGRHHGGLRWWTPMAAATPSRGDHSTAISDLACAFGGVIQGDLRLIYF
jgi:hypothetical protein